jgi:hypothetical protein
LAAYWAVCWAAWWQNGLFLNIDLIGDGYMGFDTARSDPAPQRLERGGAARLNDLPRWLWLWFPPSLFILQLAVLFGGEREFYLRWFESELGLVENGTALILVPGIIAGLLAWRFRAYLPHGLLKLWLIIFIAGSFYFAGEEVSWGQNWFGWQTPETVGAVNDQGETNIHNISSWFDQKPRLLLEIWVLFAGMGYPIWRRLKGICAYPEGDWRYWVFPSFVCFPTAVFAIMIRIPERLSGLFNHPEWQILRFAEPQEYLFAVFLTLYLMSFYRRLRQVAKAQNQAPNS